MKRLLAVAVIAVVPNLTAAAHAGDAVKIGVIMPFSGQFADPSAQVDNGIKLYLKQHGDKLGGRNAELIRKDVGGINPPVAKRLAQELVTRDNVDVLAGFSMTPNALAAADVSADAKKFMVVMNAATAIVTTKSPYMARVSLTIPQLNQTLGTWAAKRGLKKRLRHGHRLRSRHRRRSGVPEGLQGSRRRNRRLGPHGGAEPGFRRLSCSAPKTSTRRAFSS